MNESTENWISVQEKIPPRDTAVLAYIKPNAIIATKENAVWEKVTHWRPLPKPPTQDILDLLGRWDGWEGMNREVLDGAIKEIKYLRAQIASSGKDSIAVPKEALREILWAALTFNDHNFPINSVVAKCKMIARSLDVNNVAEANQLLGFDVISG